MIFEQKNIFLNCHLICIKSAMDNASVDPNSLKASAYPDFISSYTQISNVHDLSQHTDVDSSDEFSDEIDDSKTKPLGQDEGLPQLASKIMEWSSSKERLYQTYDSDPINLMRHSLSPAKGRDVDREKFYFVQMKLLKNIETYASKLSQNVNDIMKFICNSSLNMTTTTRESMEGFESTLHNTCESVDVNIKLMYKIIANCEELNKSLDVISIETLSSKIREVKQTLEVFERITERN
ncbi:hypothetical protein TYRP_014458 [Tyrophagus putrescentiae]|nr:hypothetical protein TYRP_014458 [Tyrophagus putrescentiae]